MALRDWRSPGQKWVRTEFGWKCLAEVGNGSQQQPSSSSLSLHSTVTLIESSSLKEPVTWNKDETAAKYTCCGENEMICKQIKKLHLILDQRCVPATRSSSKESSQYSTVADAINKLNFEQALNNGTCFPFICQVVDLIFKSTNTKLSGSMQNTLLRIIQRAKDISISSKKYRHVVLEMIESSLASFQKIREEQYTRFAITNIDTKVKNISVAKEELQKDLDQDTIQWGLVDLPTDCVQHIVKFLTHPRDVLNFGATNRTLHYLTEDGLVWRGLTLFHYGRVQPDSAVTEWREVFISYYKYHKVKIGQVRCELSDAARLCTKCNFVYWKAYGHPCLTASSNQESEEDNTQAHNNSPDERATCELVHLSPEQFLQLFVL